MNQSSMHDSSHTTFSVLTQLEGDAHRFIRVPLELHQPDPGDVFDLRHAVTVGTLKATPNATVVEERG